MKQLYNKNLWLNGAFALIALAVGYFANSNAMLADALFCITLMAASLKPKSLIAKIYAVLLTLLSLGTCWLSFDGIQTTVWNIGLSDAPQLWALPVLVVIFIAKFFLVFAVTDTEKTSENKKRLSNLSLMYKLSIGVTAAAIIGLFASYLLSPDFPIESSVAFAISLIALINSGKSAVEGLRKEKPVKEKSEEEALPAEEELANEDTADEEENE